MYVVIQSHLLCKIKSHTTTRFSKKPNKKKIAQRHSLKPNKKTISQKDCLKRKTNTNFKVLRQDFSSSLNAFSGRLIFLLSRFIRKSNLLANDLTTSICLFRLSGRAFTAFLKLRFLVDKRVKDDDDVGFSFFCFLDFSR